MTIEERLSIRRNREQRIVDRMNALGLGACLDFQPDPRGWPIVLTIGERQYHIGGRAR